MQCFPRFWLIHFWTRAISASVHISFLASVSLHLSLYAVGLTSPDSLDIRLDVGGIILKYSISPPPPPFFFLETQGWNTTWDWKPPHLCGQHLSKPSLSKVITRPLFCLSLENARHHAAQNTSNLAQMKELSFPAIFSQPRAGVLRQKEALMFTPLLSSWRRVCNVL